MMSRISRDEMLMMTALIQSLRSTCGRKRVGAVISKDGRIISTGYAGAPSGAPHCSQACMQIAASEGCKRTVHAEANAIAYAARTGIATEGAEIHCTLSPCEVCAKSLINAGIRKVSYLESYRILDGVELLESLGVKCQTIALPAHILQIASSQTWSTQNPLQLSLKGL